MLTFCSFSQSNSQHVALDLELPKTIERVFAENLFIIPFAMINLAPIIDAFAPNGRINPEAFGEQILRINQFDINAPQQEAQYLTQLIQQQSEHPLGNSISRFFAQTFYLPNNDHVPIWRSISRGLNFEARCTENQCPVGNKWVWIQKGFGDFDLHDLFFQRAFTCPLCHSFTEELGKVGFYRCRYLIQGRQVGKNRGAVNFDGIADRKFRVYSNRRIAQWVDLTITAQSID